MLKTFPVFAILFLLTLFIADNDVMAQFQKPDLRLEAMGGGSTAETPFWHYANTQGRVFPGSRFNQVTSFSAVSPFRRDDALFDLQYGANVINRFSDTDNALHFEQLYAGVRFHRFQLNIGRFYEGIGEGMNLTDLTFGSMIQSRNAMPVPRIQLATVGYIEVPYTAGILSLKGMYSDGILESDRTIESPFLHQKYFYFKLSIENAEVMAGISHNVVWGGIHPDRGRLPQTFSDYMRIVTSKSAEPGSGASGSEEINRLGNSVGSFDFAGTYEFCNIRLLLYRQFYLEDTVGARVWRSYWDGTYGFGLQRREGSGLINSLMYEIIYTIRQDSESIFYPQGRANYYGHSIYRSGWTYNGSVIGNPLLTFNPETRRMTNNVIAGHHIGFSGDITRKFDYRFFTTYTRNYGVCADQVIVGRCSISNDPDSFPGPPEDLELRELRHIRQNQVSFLAETSYLINDGMGLRIHSSVALDVGEFYGNRLGIMAGISITDFQRFSR